MLMLCSADFGANAVLHVGMRGQQVEDAHERRRCGVHGCEYDRAGESLSVVSGDRCDRVTLTTYAQALRPSGEGRRCSGSRGLESIA